MWSTKSAILIFFWVQWSLIQCRGWGSFYNMFEKTVKQKNTYEKFWLHKCRCFCPPSFNFFFPTLNIPTELVVANPSNFCAVEWVSIAFIHMRWNYSVLSKTFFLNISMFSTAYIQNLIGKTKPFDGLLYISFPLSVSYFNHLPPALYHLNKWQCH